MMRIVSGCDHVPLARELFLEYSASLGFDLCFQGFDQELATLPGSYAPPEGALLIGMVGEAPVGCLAMRRHTATICELKRLWVRPAFRGNGFGRRLVAEILQTAASASYQAALLDTHRSMNEAVALYRSLGFTETERFCDNPHEDVMFLRRDLR